MEVLGVLNYITLLWNYINQGTPYEEQLQKVVCSPEKSSTHSASTLNFCFRQGKPHTCGSNNNSRVDFCGLLNGYSNKSTSRHWKSRPAQFISMTEPSSP